MDLQLIVPWIAAALSFSSLASQLYTVFTSPSKKNSEDIAGIRKDQAAHDRRIQRLEDELRHLPDRETAHRLELGMKDLSGRLDALDERLKPVAAIGERLQEFLLEQAKK